VRPQNQKTDLDTHQKLGFGSVSPKKRGFGFKTDPGLNILFTFAVPCMIWSYKVLLYVYVYKGYAMKNIIIARIFNVLSDFKFSIYLALKSQEIFCLPSSLYGVVGIKVLFNQSLYCRLIYI